LKTLHILRNDQISKFSNSKNLEIENVQIFLKNIKLEKINNRKIRENRWEK
jgi:hypothetical protein